MKYMIWALLAHKYTNTISSIFILFDIYRHYLDVQHDFTNFGGCRMTGGLRIRFGALSPLWNKELGGVRRTLEDVGLLESGRFGGSNNCQELWGHWSSCVFIFLLLSFQAMTSYAVDDT